MLTSVLGLIALALGVVSVLIFYGYIVGTGTGMLPRGEPADGALPWLSNAGLLAQFALQHSGMARQWFKTWCQRWLPATIERPLYVAASGIALAALTVGWQPLPGNPLWNGPIWIESISILAIAGAGGFVVFFVPVTFFGLGVSSNREPLRTNGPYRFVRHPLMLAVLIAIWAQPIMPPELFLMNVGMTLYILIAIRLEERDLVREFGTEYEKYRSEVPALVPWKWTSI